LTGALPGALPGAVLLASATAVAAESATEAPSAPAPDVADPSTPPVAGAPTTDVAGASTPPVAAVPTTDIAVESIPDVVNPSMPPIAGPPTPPVTRASTMTYPVPLQGAADLPDHGPTPKTPRHRTFGMSMDVGVPDGAALGLVVRPHFDWLRIGGAVTHNGIAPGLRLGVTIDPVAFPIAPTLTVEGGHYWQGTIPGVQDSPDVGYNYANFHLGLEIGNRSTFRFFLRGGASWIDVNTANFKGSTGTNGMVSANGSSTTSGSGFGNPTFNGWLAPTGKLGFSLYF
jgi:hypothetical protein